MTTNKISIVFISDNLELEPLIKNIRESEYEAFAIRIEGSVTSRAIEMAKDCTTLLRNRKKAVFLEVDSLEFLTGDITLPNIVYLTEKTKVEDLPGILDLCKKNSIKVVYRIFIDEEQKLIQDIDLYNSIHTFYGNTYFFLRIRNIKNTLKAVSCCEERIKDLSQVYFLDVPQCFPSEKIKTSTSAFLDICQQIDFKISSYDKVALLSQFYKVKNICLPCKSCGECLGVKKDSSIEPRTLQSSKSWSASLYDILMSPNVNIIEYDPKNKTEFGTRILESLQERRLKRDFEGDDFYYVWDFKSSFYFNRPLNPEPMWQDDPRGLPSVNWQFIGKGIPELEWKSKCDMLIPTHGVVTTAKVKFDKSWSAQKQEDLDNFTFNVIKNTILANGGDKNKLEQKGNDLLYNGKKFAGKEWKFVGNIGYIENVVLTCDYTTEKEWFDKIYHWSGEKAITGITEEIPAVTKELLISNLYKEARKFLNV